MFISAFRMVRGPYALCWRREVCRFPARAREPRGRGGEPVTSQGGNPKGQEGFPSRADEFAPELQNTAHDRGMPWDGICAYVCARACGDIHISMG